MLVILKKIFGLKVVYPKSKEQSREVYNQLYFFIKDDTLNFLKLKNPKVIFDLGASYGILTSLYAKLFPNANIYSFEPNPFAFDYASELIKLNEFNNVKIFNKGVGDKDVVKEFYINTSHFESASFISNDFNKSGVKKEIKMIDISGFIAANKIESIDFLKMDIEGGEFSLIQHLDESKQLKIIKNMFIEVHVDIDNYNETSLGLILQTLEKNKFYYKIHSSGSNFNRYYRYLVWASQDPL